MEIRESIDDREVLEVLRQLKEAVGGRLADPMRKVGRSMKTSTQMRFNDQVAPDGTPWVPSIRVRRHGGQTLSLSARLRNSFTYISDDNSVVWGTNVAYAPALHYGSHATVPVKAFLRRVTVVFGRRLKQPTTARVHSFMRHMNLPARPILGMSAADRTDVLRIFREHLSRVVQQGKG